MELYPFCETGFVSAFALTHGAEGLHMYISLVFPLSAFPLIRILQDVDPSCCQYS